MTSRQRTLAAIHRPAPASHDREADLVSPPLLELAGSFVDRSNTLTGPVTVQVDIFANYGRENESHESLAFRLNDLSDRKAVAAVTFGPQGEATVVRNKK